MPTNKTIAVLTTHELEEVLLNTLNKSKTIESQESAEKEQKQENLKFYTIREACKLLNCCRTTIYNWCRQGLISYTKIGRRVLFKKSDLENAGSQVSIENNRMNLTINGGKNAR